MYAGMKEYGVCPECGDTLSCVVQDGHPDDGLIYCPSCPWNERCGPDHDEADKPSWKMVILDSTLKAGAFISKSALPEVFSDIRIEIDTYGMVSLQDERDGKMILLHPEQVRHLLQIFKRPNIIKALKS